jgi:hypothetical protein
MACWGRCHATALTSWQAGHARPAHLACTDEHAFKHAWWRQLRQHMRPGRAAGWPQDGQAGQFEDGSAQQGGSLKQQMMTQPLRSLQILELLGEGAVGAGGAGGVGGGGSPSGRF